MKYVVVYVAYAYGRPEVATKPFHRRRDAVAFAQTRPNAYIEKHDQGQVTRIWP